MTKTSKKISAQLADEVHEVGENLKEPITDLVTSAVETSLDVVESVTAGIGRILGAVLDEGARVTDKLRQGLESSEH